MPSTTRGAFPYPAATDNWKQIRAALQALADRSALVGALWSATTAAGRGAAGTAGRFHRATDTGAVGLDTGTSWVEFLLTSGSQSVAGAKDFTGGLLDNGTAVYSPNNPPPAGGAVIYQTLSGVVSIPTGGSGDVVVNVTIPAVNLAKRQTRLLGTSCYIISSNSQGSVIAPAAVQLELTSSTNLRVTVARGSFVGLVVGGTVSYEITEWT